jgi:hypothetical protein
MIPMIAESRVNPSTRSHVSPMIAMIAESHVSPMIAMIAESHVSPMIARKVDAGNVIVRRKTAAVTMD